MGLAGWQRLFQEVVHINMWKCAPYFFVWYAYCHRIAKFKHDSLSKTAALVFISQAPVKQLIRRSGSVHITIAIMRNIYICLNVLFVLSYLPGIIYVSSSSVLHDKVKLRAMASWRANLTLAICYTTYTSIKKQFIGLLSISQWFRRAWLECHRNESKQT